MQGALGPLMGGEGWAENGGNWTAQEDAQVPSSCHHHTCFSHQERGRPERHLLCLHHDPGDAQVSQHGRCLLRCKDPPQLQAKHGGDLGKRQALPVSVLAAAPCASAFLQAPSRVARCWGMHAPQNTSFPIPNPTSDWGILQEHVSVSSPAGWAGWVGGSLLKATLVLLSSRCADVPLALGLPETHPWFNRAGSQG